MQVMNWESEGRCVCLLSSSFMLITNGTDSH